VEDVKSFWNHRAADPSLDDAQVTHPDVWQRRLEIELAGRCLRASDRAIDVGCGAGLGTLAFAPLVREIVGVDASPGMIERAQRAESQAPAPNARFQVANVLEIGADTLGLFDVALTIRCLINLPDWASQKAALKRIAGVLEPGGRLVLVEGSRDGREGLNRLREAVGLERMPEVWHNRDLVEAELLPALEEDFVLRERHGLGTYDLVARVVHPLLVAPEKPRYEAAINEVAARVALAYGGPAEISRVLFLVLERRH
jgi:SAM-dependent methyltransferase